MRRTSLLLCLFLTACVTVRSLHIEPLDPVRDRPLVVESPVKVHLTDGSTVVFSKGVAVVGDKVTGEGFRYDEMLKLTEPVTEIALDDVAAMESFQTPVNTGATAAASTGATVGGGMGGLMIFKAIFGSCPTTYSLDDERPVLEAESFSYSIAPGFEMRDIDRLGIGGGRARVELEMRNEALETHYINQVELLAVTHAAGQLVVGDHRGRPLVLDSLRPPRSAEASDGSAVAAALAARDGAATRAPDARLANVSGDNFDDYLELTFDVERGVRQALVLRLRNSLLNTVLLYDVMLAGQGARAADWMGRDLTRLGPRYRLASWYRERMGMRVAVWQGGRWREVASFDDTGPIAWKDIAIPLPRVRESQVRVRLAYVTDNWRIDHAALANVAGRGAFERVPLAEVRDAYGAVHDEARANLGDADDRYLITKPGEYLRYVFEPGLPRDGQARTFFLSATGYYIEWLRNDWLRAGNGNVFRPHDDAIVTAIERWRGQRDELRARFDATMINVR